MILGFDKSFPFLFDIDFPLPDHYWQIQPIARDFVEKLFAIEGRLYTIGQPSAESVQIYQNLYATLVAHIGEDNTQALCKWGNALNLRHNKLEFKLSYFRSELIRASRADEENHPIDSQMLPLRILLSRYWHHWRGTSNAIDEIEQIPRDAWEEMAYRHYFLIEGDRREPVMLISPLVFLESLINYLSDMRLVMQLRTIPNIEELLTRLGVLEHYQEILAILP